MPVLVFSQANTTDVSVPSGSVALRYCAPTSHCQFSRFSYDFIARPGEETNQPCSEASVTVSPKLSRPRRYSTPGTRSDIDIPSNVTWSKSPFAR